MLGGSRERRGRRTMFPAAVLDGQSVARGVPAAGPQPDLDALAARIHAHFDGTPRHRAELKHALQRQFAQLSDAGLLRRR